MTPVLVGVGSAVAVVVMLFGFGTTLAGRRFGLLHAVAVGLIEAVLLVQTAVVLVGLSRGHDLADAPTFWGYLAGVLLIPVLAGLWAWTEPTRWAGTQVALGALAVAVMEWRLLQLWEGTGA
ncbi:hypothetical protein [Blastococcus tunisiensis]|jgi:hypothetical protein|uniref:Integral membrane protein n=1 Tax=Blastococcus tunisiensis TaxID=1798228 RepID=A0A1I2KAY8_9ACTN|nr:hypothetical protein [Blastococcus sp. DSM 46838]SFF63390.1 hypothetical protein SAMN05216574_12033 [Blastococcus sp. DSM 46838]